MFYKHFLIKKDGEEVLYLYLLNTQEFANDLRKSGNSDSIYQKVRNYIENSGINFKGKRVFLVVNGIIVSSLKLDTLNLNTGKSYTLEDIIKNYPQEDVEILDLEDHPSLKFVDMTRSNGVLDRMKLEDYVFGIVGGEMPAIFHEEALKAQAVIARTYAMKRLDKGLEIRDYNKTQIFRDIDYLKKLWGEHFEKYYKKIKMVVRSTQGEVIKYDNDFIDTYYHLINNGRTENSKEVLKLSYPYLVSVPSNWDLKESGLVGTRKVSNEYLSKLLDIPITKKTTVKILSKTTGDCVKYVQFDNKVFDGLIISRRLALNSNDFSVYIDDDATTFTTKGNGHGLGLSKYGAEGMAESGYTYLQILNHYYPNTVIEKIKK